MRPEAEPAPPPQPRSPWRFLPLVLLLGLLGILRVSSQARLTELDFERERLVRLVREQNSRQEQLIQQRRALVSDQRLSAIAAAENMVSPPPPQTIQVGLLPPPKTYWELPEEPSPATSLAGRQLGLLPRSHPPTRGRP